MLEEIDFSRFQKKVCIFIFIVESTASNNFKHVYADNLISVLMNDLLKAPGRLSCCSGTDKEGI